MSSTRFTTPNITETRPVRSGVGLTHDVDRGAGNGAPRADQSPQKVLTLLPAVLVVLLLVLATVFDGAFAVRYWAPPAAFVSAIVCVALLRGGAAGARGKWIGIALAGVWGLVAWTFLSIAWSPRPGDAWEGANRALLYAGLATLPFLILASRRTVAVIGYLTVAGIAGIAVYTLVGIYADPDGFFLAGRLDGPVRYRNGTACLFAVAFWPLICLAATRDANRLLRGLALAQATLTLGLAFLTQSRGVVVGLAAGGLAALLLSPDRVRRACLAGLSIVAVAVAAPALLTPYRAFDAGRGDVTSADIGSASSALTVLVLVMLLVGFGLALFDRGLRPASPALRHMRTAARTGVACAAVLAVIGALVLTGNPFAFASDKWTEFTSLQTTSSTATRLVSTEGQRYDMWRIAFDQWRGAPIAGGGEASYPVDYYAERRTDRNTETPHSLPFSVLAELGLVGLALLAAFVIGMGGAILSGWRSAGASARRSAAGLAAAGLVVLGQALVEWIWVIPGLMGLGILCLSLGAAQVAPIHGEAPGPAAPALWARRLAALGLAAGVASVTFVYLSDFQVRRARALGPAAVEERLSAAKAAHRLNPLSLPPRYLRASALETMGRRADARRELLEALDREPDNFAVLGLLGDFELRGGRRATARRYYRRALALNPRDLGLQKLARGAS